MQYWAMILELYRTQARTTFQNTFTKPPLKGMHHFYVTTAPHTIIRDS